MKTVLQRVKSASVTVDGQLISTIGKGILVFAAIGREDTTKEVESMASKVLKVKLWDDEKGAKWKSSVQDIGGEVLCVSQFTLLASTKKGNKPDFHKSAGGVQAKQLYDSFFSKLQSLYTADKVKDGVFQAMMDVGLVNDGPVTIEIETNPPIMDNPTEFELPEDVEMLKGKVQKTFMLPASLLE
ncbi:D-tyrosyl-tRNA(Tyr) deacylase [Elasticomyces elasticus]|nr:D-tyrosyl-tRNA(Tyr) deacylase [Elasticomyces elasticus]KAK5005016.1 hypothetical protein LTR28_008219 [Elasticomyces elasticus]